MEKKTLSKNVEFIKTRRSTGEELEHTMITSNWFTVYQDRARYEGRRLYWIAENAFEVIFTEKDYTATLIKH